MLGKFGFLNQAIVIVEAIWINGTKYSRMDQVKFVEDSLYKIWRDTVFLSRPYPFKFFKGCLPQILLGPFVNTLSQMLFGKFVRPNNEMPRSWKWYIVY